MPLLVALNVRPTVQKLKPTENNGRLAHLIVDKFNRKCQQPGKKIP